MTSRAGCCIIEHNVILCDLQVDSVIFKQLLLFHCLGFYFKGYSHLDGKNLWYFYCLFTCEDLWSLNFALSDSFDNLEMITQTFSHFRRDFLGIFLLKLDSEGSKNFFFHWKSPELKRIWLSPTDGNIDLRWFWWARTYQDQCARPNTLFLFWKLFSFSVSHVIATRGESDEMAHKLHRYLIYIHILYRSRQCLNNIWRADL